MVLIFALNGKPSSPNTAKRKQQTNRLPILTANRRDTPPETQKRRQDFSCRQTDTPLFYIKHLFLVFPGHKFSAATAGVVFVRRFLSDEVDVHC